MHNKCTQEMNSNLPNECKKFKRNCQHLQQILLEAHHILSEIKEEQIYFPQNLEDQIFNADMKKLNEILSYDPALIILGQSYEAKDLFLSKILTEGLISASHLQEWRRISYGLPNSLTLSQAPSHNQQKIQTNIETLPCAVESCLEADEQSKKISIEEIKVVHPLIKENFQILVSPDERTLVPPAIYNAIQQDSFKMLPILVFAIGKDALTEEDIAELHNLKEHYPDIPVVFVNTVDINCDNLQNTNFKYSENCLATSIGNNSELAPNSEKKMFVNRHVLALVHELTSLGYLHLQNSKGHPVSTQSHISESTTRTDFIDLSKLDSFVFFMRRCFQSYLIEASNILSDILSECVHHFILSAYDMARVIQVTPRRIQYAQEKERILYKNLIITAREKQKEIQQIIETTLLEMKDELVEKAYNYNYCGVIPSESSVVRSLQEVRVATSEIHNLVLSELSSSVSSHLVASVDCFQEIYIGTLQRCLESLEKNWHIQELNCLASTALKQTLSAAYNLKLSASSSSNFLHSFFDRLRKLLHSLQFPFSSPPCINASWRERVASEMLDSLNASQLAKCVSLQLQEKVKASHEAFELALESLQVHCSGYLQRTETQKLAIRKRHAPKLARLALESMSICDMIRYGLPKLGKELGRGQYGVVFMCDSWGGVGPCAVKSIVPPDDKHWNDLAMEFFCTRKIPEHKHIVQLRGSVIDSSYGEGCMPSVLLIMDKLARDLYSGLRSGLTLHERLQIAMDVANGLRFIHSQGLVHRDIKLKNVLLDSNNRAKITDFGFCMPEAMMSGSIVGTPVHMAPELLSGNYNSSVDVYAFGILLWYLCAGHVHLPYAFERFQNKEQLWTSVKRGIRPERLPYFDVNCWELMQQCWAAEPMKRPALGYVLPQLDAIMKQYTEI